MSTECAHKFEKWHPISDPLFNGVRCVKCSKVTRADLLPSATVEMRALNPPQPVTINGRPIGLEDVAVMYAAERQAADAYLSDFSGAPPILTGRPAGEHKDEGKPAVQYLEPEFLEAVGRAMGYGAKKYAERNYRKGIAQSRLVGSVLRHIFAWMRREDVDAESGLPHLAHAGASLNMLMWMSIHRLDLDDR
jgi:hypothetical protein